MKQPRIFSCLFVPIFPSNVFVRQVHRKQESEAIAAIHWLRGSHFDASLEINDIQSQRYQLMAVGDDGFSHNKMSVWKSFRQPATVRALVIMLGIMFFMQASGVNAVLFYSTSIFQVCTYKVCL